MKPYRILVTGSRDWPDAQAVANALNDAHDRLPPGATLVVVHGGCKTGADFDAHAWCLRRQHLGDPVAEEKHRADWLTHRQAAGPIRNEHMVSLGADACLAFIGPCTSPRCQRPEPHPSHGASGCADLAERAGIPTCRYTTPRPPVRLAPTGPDPNHQEQHTTTPADEIQTAADKLRNLATAATPGQWWAEELPPNEHRTCPAHWVKTEHDDGNMVSSQVVADCPWRQADAAYIAAMHPGVGAALADWLEFHAEMTDRLHALVDGVPDAHDHPALAVARAINGGEQR